MKRIINILSIAAVTLFASACMDLSPKAQLSDAQVWSNASNFSLFANQFYGWTRDFQGSDYMSSWTDGVHSDTRSDLVATPNLNVYSAGTNAIPSTDSNYGTLYKRIYYTNLLLKNAESFEPQADIAVPMGEAYFFRAYFYFELVQIFGDVIYVDTPLDLDSEKMYGKRDDRAEVIRHCIADLKKAVELLPDMPTEDGRVAKGAANAFLSRVALYEGTWQKFHNNNTAAANEFLSIAAAAAKAVIDSKAYTLFYSDALGGKDSYRYLFILENVDCNPAKLTKADNKEYIFSHRHDEATKKIGTNITHGAQNSGVYVTRKLADLYRCQDGLPIAKSPKFQGYTGQNTEFADRDNRMNATLLRHGQKYWNNDGKWRTTWTVADEDDALTCDRRSQSGYINNKWATERKVDDTNEGYDYPVIRYAEVLLNYAEAVYEQGESISDADLDLSLNVVRQRSNPDMVKLSNGLVSANGLSMRDEIRAERTVELALEGFRVDDLKRWKTAETEMPQDLRGIPMTGWFATNWTNQTRPLDADGCIILYDGRVWAEKNYLYPIPSDELQLNPELGQNKGWN
ncbi:MAG: RagB/SusD family nutrient uptake outer membrane protein [Bacteroidales bacterium]|nr:RagB/SusD family nutrient uptake outer membrane protein [Bacteroidales bacterium]